jgi:hypothetical protein|nr:hypothetical protein [uncultured Mediterranean phage uvMED]
MANIAKAIKSINPNACFHYEEDDISTLVWDNGTTPISQADIEAKISELETQEEADVQAKINLKASAKAKLIAGEALTQDEADTIVL